MTGGGGVGQVLTSLSVLPSIGVSDRGGHRDHNPQLVTFMATWSADPVPRAWATILVAGANFHCLCPQLVPAPGAILSARNIWGPKFSLPSLKIRVYSVELWTAKNY